MVAPRGSTPLPARRHGDRWRPAPVSCPRRALLDGECPGNERAVRGGAGEGVGTRRPLTASRRLGRPDQRQFGAGFHPQQVQRPGRPRRGDGAVDVPECRQLRLRDVRFRGERDVPRVALEDRPVDIGTVRVIVGVTFFPEGVDGEVSRQAARQGRWRGAVAGPAASGAAASGGASGTRCHDAVPIPPLATIVSLSASW